MKTLLEICCTLTLFGATASAQNPLNCIGDTAAGENVAKKVCADAKASDVGIAWAKLEGTTLKIWIFPSLGKSLILNQIEAEVMITALRALMKKEFGHENGKLQFFYVTDTNGKEPILEYLVERNQR